MQINLVFLKEKNINFNKFFFKKIPNSHIIFKDSTVNKLFKYTITA